MKSDPKHCIEVCNQLLRGELSAVETYDQTIEKFSDDPAVTVLRTIRQEHATAVGILRQQVHDMGGTPSTDSGAWGNFAAAVQGTAKVFGKSSALKGLKEGEEHGLKEYENALDDEDMMPEHKEPIRMRLIPETERHVAVLESLEVSA